MITPMQHATLICRPEDAELLLEALRGLGLLHLELKQVADEHLDELKARQSQLSKALQKLASIEEELPQELEWSGEEALEQFEAAQRRLQRIAALEARIQKEAHSWEPFGHLQSDLLQELREGGLDLLFLRASESPVHTPKDALWIPAAPGYSLLIGKAGELPEVDSLSMPFRSLETLETRKARLIQLRRQEQNHLAALKGSLPRLEALQATLTEDIEFLQARNSLDQESGLSWISGFVPAEQTESLKSLATEVGVALSLREPEAEDATPTLLKQGPLVSWIQPVLGFLGVTPGYQEVDIGWSFLLFLCLFSGMIIGDAGYGLLLLLGVGTLNLVKPSSRGKFSNLMLSMGATTFTWGMLSNNLFGVRAFPSFVVVPALAGDNPVPIMQFCFVLGAIHLTLAHLWNMWNDRKSLKALAQLGWIGSTWSMYCLTGTMVLGWPSLPGFVTPLLIISILLILAFMTPLSKIKSEWVNHMMLPLDLVNNFVDVVSYVRLYAVGMGTFALASSFNELLLGGEQSNVLVTGIMMIFLILGHGLNFILAAMGILVHGIRLNTLEFASHMGLTWSGIPYKPFKKTVSEPLD